MIPEKSFVALYGPPASFKSFIAMDIAECIASGRPWLGKEINGTGPVLYIAGEGHGGIGARIAAIKQHHKTPDSSQLYVVRSMPDAYIDRWIKNGQRVSAVWCVVVPPENCPRPESRRNKK